MTFYSKACTKQDILMCKNKLVTTLWWTNYGMVTMSLNDLQHVALSALLLLISQHIRGC